MVEKLKACLRNEASALPQSETEFSDWLYGCDSKYKKAENALTERACRLLPQIRGESLIRLLTWSSSRRRCPGRRGFGVDI